MAVEITVPQVSQEIKKPQKGMTNEPYAEAILEILNDLNNKYIKKLARAGAIIMPTAHTRLNGRAKYKKFMNCNEADCIFANSGWPEKL